MVGGMHVGAGSELDGLPMFEMSTQTRVIAVTREDAPVQLHPRRDARLSAGDTVFLVGPIGNCLPPCARVSRPTTGFAPCGVLDDAEVESKAS